ncbi:10745_t:CDS:2 [Funneliformis mosseae]|uniref:Restriction of telomere capping protein 4 n=1 Tax=Funneliformis mosseae TaxID=27381 RepID=A0A9N8UYQ5_FUNMO|nr:10745_t:CDS:2 [Funneliformis mosseae]
MQKRNTKLGGKEPLVKNKRFPKENEIEHTGTFKKSTNGLHGGSSKEHSPFQKVSNYTHTPPRNITFPINKLQKKYILKELTNKFENLNMSDPDDDYFMDISPNIKRDVIIIDDEPETLNNQNDEFRAPSPTRNKYANLPEIDLLSDDETSIQSSTSRRKGSAEHKRCPFCNEAIPLPLPERIRAYLIKINPSARDKLSDQTQNISPSSDVALCAYQEFGRARARKPTILMGRFQKFQPGYYGSKGASIIFSSLVSLFMDTNILTMDMTKPQEPLEYLNQVLVPETAIRLISRDRGGIPLEDARKVMESSVEFGMYVHDVDDDLDNK